MGVKHPSNSLSTVLLLKVIKKLEAHVFKFFDYPKMSFVSQPAPDAVSAWVQKAAQHVREVTVYLERDIHLTQCQIDEFWSYILKKKRT